GSVVPWLVTLVDRRAVLGRHVASIDDVLDAERHAGQWPALAAFVERARLRDHLVRVQVMPRLHLWLARSDALEAGARHRFAGGLAGVDSRYDLRRRQFIQRCRQLAHGSLFMVRCSWFDTCSPLELVLLFTYHESRSTYHDPLSVNTDTGGLDHLRPGGQFLFDERRKLFRRAADRMRANARNALFYLGNRQGFDDFLMQPADHCAGRSRGNHHALPFIHFIAGPAGFGHSRDFA